MKKTKQNDEQGRSLYTALVSRFRNKAEPKSGAARQKEAFIGADIAQRGAFGNRTLLWLVAAVTLFLQIISFITTLNGAKVYLGGIFFLAPLLFALAIQCTVYFLSNSLRHKIAPMRLVVLAVAVVCSSYFSYIGIYNTINPPQHYLEARYEAIYRSLNSSYDSVREKFTSGVRDNTNLMVNHVTEQYTALLVRNTELQSCRDELEKVGSGITNQLRAPYRNSYEHYEDYVAAYNAYLSSISQNSGIEYSANQATVLSKYGFASQQEFAAALSAGAGKAEALQASINSMAQKVGVTAAENPAVTLESLRKAMLQGLADAAVSGAPSADTELLYSQFANLYTGLGGAKLPADVLADFRTGIAFAQENFMDDFQTAAAKLPAGKATQENAMELKGELDTQILRAVSVINTVSPKSTPLSAADERYIIYDLYILPLKNLVEADTAGMARFCLLMAALIDLLTVLFAVATRDRRPLLLARKTRTLTQNGTHFAEQVYTSLLLGGGENATERLGIFLERFEVSESTAKNGYSLCARKSALAGFTQLLSLLCQFNFARVIPAEAYRELMRGNTRGTEAEPLYGEEESGEMVQSGDDMVLLKSSFQLWANEKLSAAEDWRQTQNEPKPELAVQGEMV